MVARYEVTEITEATVSTASILQKLGTRSGALTRPESEALVACIRQHRGSSVNIHNLVQWLRRACKAGKGDPGKEAPKPGNPRRFRGPAA
jgi:hypothetical protein